MNSTRKLSKFLSSSFSNSGDTDRDIQEIKKDSLRADMMLAVDDGTRHWVYTLGFTPPRKASLHNIRVGGSNVTVEQVVQNGRSKKDLKLDDAGFELKPKCPTVLSTEQFYQLQAGGMDRSKNALLDLYYTEVEQFVQKELGCDKVIAFHSQVRSKGANGERTGVAPYAGVAPHTDSFPSSSEKTALDLLKMKQDDEKYKRFCFLNVWRNISDVNPVSNHHLGLVDARTTVKPDDYIVRDTIIRDDKNRQNDFSTVAYALSIRHADNYRWYYFPNMTKKECILFKQFDSDWTKPARMCPHLSVSDKYADDESAAFNRESIECRVVAYWKTALVDSMPCNEKYTSRLSLVKDPVAHASQLALVAVQTASVWQLLAALWNKIPLVGRVVNQIMGDPLQLFVNRSPPYSGRPLDYHFVSCMAVDSYPQWPASAKFWIKSVAKKHATDVESALFEITKTLVEDRGNRLGTKAFAPEEKEDIVSYLLESAVYRRVAKTHWGSLLAFPETKKEE